MIDTPELRRLVHIADQRRARFCALPVPTAAMVEEDDPRVEEWHMLSDSATIALLSASTDLIDYLITALGMRSELRTGRG